MKLRQGDLAGIVLTRGWADVENFGERTQRQAMPTGIS